MLPIWGRVRQNGIWLFGVLRVQNKVIHHESSPKWVHFFHLTHHVMAFEICRMIFATTGTGHAFPAAAITCAFVSPASLAAAWIVGGSPCSFRHSWVAKPPKKWRTSQFNLTFPVFWETYESVFFFFKGNLNIKYQKKIQNFPKNANNLLG